MYREENENNLTRNSEENPKFKANCSSGMPLTLPQLKEKVSFTAVLRADGVKVSSAGGLMECCCPRPEHRESTPSFKIYNDARAKCYGCDWSGDVIEYVKQRDRTNFLGAFMWLEENYERFPRATVYTSDIRDSRSSSSPKPLTPVEKERCVAAANHLAEDRLAWHGIAFERDWDDETLGLLARAGDLGWHNDQLAFIYENGMKVRGWPGRDFRWNCGSPSLWRSHLLQDENIGAIFIAEGETDAISLIDGDVENTGGTVVAIPSSTTIRSEWFEPMRDQIVVLCFDNDDAGESATKKVAKMLEGVASQIRYVDFGSSDFNDISDVHQKLGGKGLLDWLTDTIKPWNQEPPNDGGNNKKPSNPPPQKPSGASPAKNPPAAGELPPIYYSTATKEYFVQAEGETWIPVNENSVKRHLKAAGFKHGKEDVTPLETALNDIQLKHGVVYSAPLAGHDAGIHKINGVNVLVTQSPKFIEPAEGDFPILREMLTRMFVTAAKDQLPYLYSWIKVHLECFNARKWYPHQAMAFCGPVDCGKSLLQRLITELTGGRSAKPHQFMCGDTNFNGDLFEAEHLMVEDDTESTHHAKRKVFGAHLKAFAANRDQRCHGKFLKGLVLHPRWAVTISVNDEPQRLLVLPPIDQDTEDKIILLKVNQCKMPMSTETLDEKDTFWNTLISELPAFVGFLQKWEIPNELRSAKYGVKHYHHPDILEAVDEVSNELRLLNLIDRGLLFHGGQNWKGTAHDLEHHLSRENSSVQYDARKLFYFPTACGTYLSNLAKKCPERVSRLPRSKDVREWQISAMPGRHYNGEVFSEPPVTENN